MSVPASLLDFKPDDDDNESISNFLVGKLVIDDDEVSVLETHGFVLILQRCLGEGAKNIITYVLWEFCTWCYGSSYKIEQVGSILSTK